MIPASMSSMWVSSLLTKNVRSRPGTAETSFGNVSSWKMYAIVRILSLMRPIRDARDLGVGRSGNRSANFGLRVPFDGRLRRSAAFFAPDERNFGAGHAVRDIHHRQRDHRALIESVAGICGQSDGFPVLQHLVIRQR